MIDRLIEEIEWPGRRVEGAADSARPGEEGLTQETEEEAEEKARPQLLSNEYAPLVRERLDEAHRAVQDMENRGKDMLDEHLNADVTELPQTAEAVKYIAGTHPDYGTDFPEVPEGDQLEDGVINGDTVRRAYNIMENGDKLGLGFDLKDSVMSGTGNVKPVEPVTNPAVAAGERDIQTREPEPIPNAIEKKERERKLSLWLQVAYAVGGFLLKFVANFVESVGDTVKGALTIKIGPFKLSLGKWLAIPIYWIADGLARLADKLLAKALGHNPEESAPSPEPPTRSAGAGDTDSERRQRRASSELGFTDKSYEPPPTLENVRHNPHGAPFSEPGAGDQLLMAAQRVLRTTGALVRDAEDNRPAQALDLFDRARVLKQDLAFHEDTAQFWGAPSQDEVETTAAEEELALEPPVQRARQRGRFGRCP